MNRPATGATADGAWNPGIESRIPQEVLHLATLFRSEHVFTSLASALELNGLTGLPVAELVVFRPPRLALHELLIRITADFAVPDGSKIGDLGINFREMARLLLARYVAPRMVDLDAAYAAARAEIAAHVDLAFAEVLRAPDATAAASAGSFRWFKRAAAKPSPAIVATPRWGPEEIAEFERRAAAAGAPLSGLIDRSIARVLAGLFATQGAPWGTREIIFSLATDIAVNVHGSDVIGSILDPLLRDAATREGYRLLPDQAHPVVINTKGASASGKSTLRPLQRKLAGELGLEWRDFALISPDIWRKQLLDYASLGEHYRYAGAFTAEELQIVDQKLDRHMARKHQRSGTSHLLIDRFRFDSFAPDSGEAGSNLLTRFGHTVYLFFVITPPEQLVERAWQRGLEFGRFKAVDDTLAHAVEAYNGVPAVFFTWVGRDDKRFRFEFLDNTVTLGERPRTVAFGDNRTLHILAIGPLLDIERFGRIDVNAREPRALYPDRANLRPERNVGLIKRCVGEFRSVDFAEQSSGRIYLRIEAGAPVWKDSSVLNRQMIDPDSRAGLAAVASESALARATETGEPRWLLPAVAESGAVTLGAWGDHQSKKLQ